MKILLDVSKTNIDYLSARAKSFLIPAKTGIHQRDFDVIECDVPRDIYQEWAGRQRNLNEILPIGFDLDSLPVGAKITVTER